MCIHTCCNIILYNSMAYYALVSCVGWLRVIDLVL